MKRKAKRKLPPNPTSFTRRKDGRFQCVHCRRIVSPTGFGTANHRRGCEPAWQDRWGADAERAWEGR